MLRALLRLLSTVVFWVPPARLVKVTVWHRMQVIGIITDDTTLAAFDALWSQKTEQPKGTRTTFQYSFDLRTIQGTKHSSTRWLYNLQGLAKVLVTPSFGFHIPIYRITSRDELHRLIGIVRRTPIVRQPEPSSKV